MLSWLAAVAAGLIAGAVQYGAGRRGGGGGAGGGTARGAGATLGPALLRVVAVTLLVALVLDAPGGRRRASAPFAALDVSASWLRGGDAGAYGRALRAARSAGADSLFLTGDSVRAAAPPKEPADPASRARPARASMSCRATLAPTSPCSRSTRRGRRCAVTRSRSASASRRARAAQPRPRSS